MMSHWEITCIFDIIEHYGIYTRPLTVKLIILKEENLECLDLFS